MKNGKGLIILLFCPAFAELQTDMTDLTADLESSGIPTLDHKNYIMKVFFPGVSDHPILNDPKVRRYLDEGTIV
jgi:plexin A